MGFRAAKYQILKALREGAYGHETRDEIDEKNLLQCGEVTAEDVIEIVNRCNGRHHQESAHHHIASVMVHVLRRDGWYIKFYFLEPNAIFISVHK